MKEKAFGIVRSSQFIYHSPFIICLLVGVLPRAILFFSHVMSRQEDQNVREFGQRF